MVEGLNETGRAQALNEFLGGTLHLVDTVTDDSDTATELTNKSQATLSTADADWTLNVDNAAGTTELTNSAQLSFGNQDGYNAVEVVLQSTVNSDRFVIVDEPNDPQLTGEEVFIPGGNLSYTLGGE